jgi:hypothetical protein
VSKAKSVAFTEEGLSEAQRLFEKHVTVLDGQTKA